jgi:hypothetical protein
MQGRGKLSKKAVTQDWLKWTDNTFYAAYARMRAVLFFGSKIPKAQSWSLFTQL